jgi:hypothetical protein
MLQEHLLLQDSDMLLDVCEGLGFAADDPWRQQQVMLMRQRRQSYTSTAAVRTGSSSEQQQEEEGGEGEQSLVEVAAAAGEAVRQDSMLHPVGSASLQVRVGSMHHHQGCPACKRVDGAKGATTFCWYSCL